ncbi:Fic family protein [Thiolinea disciformis]|uniref:Fic family protein n=1 Tax=Thiolinea disciformis TaxID=125614 RepID=UPI00037EA56C|nr:Fic family protein [Thiolinea disciformis]
MLSERQQLILDKFLENPAQNLAVGDLLPWVEVGRTTLFRDLSQLVEQGILSPDAPTRARTYRLNPDSEPYLRWDLSRPPQERPVVYYYADWLDIYQPNQYSLLSPYQLEKLHKAGKVCDSTADYAQLLNTAAIDWLYNSANLEGIKLSWLDSKALLEFNERPTQLSQAAINNLCKQRTALNYLIDQRSHLKVDDLYIAQLHALLGAGSLQDATISSNLRVRTLSFTESAYLPLNDPEQIQYYFAQFCDKAQAIHDPYEQAIFTLLFLSYLQAFREANNRTARLCLNIPLCQQQLAPFTWSEVSKREYLFGLLALYERQRHEFLVNTFVQAYVKSAKRYKALVQGSEDIALVSAFA